MHLYYLIFVFVLSLLCYFASCSRFLINDCIIKSTIMYNQCLEADEILKEYDDVDNLRLDHILDPDEMEDEISCITPISILRYQ